MRLFSYKWISRANTCRSPQACILHCRSGTVMMTAKDELKKIFLTLLSHSFFDELSAGSDREQCCSSYGCTSLGSAGYFNANGEQPTVQQKRCYLRKPFFLMVF